MENQGYTDLKQALTIRKNLMEYHDSLYIGMIQQINAQCKDILKDDMGSNFVRSCARDIAGEAVRNFFDTSEFYITVDQLAERIIKFDYENEYDCLLENSQIQKQVFNYNDAESSSYMQDILGSIDGSQAKLFTEDRSTDKADSKGRNNYRESRKDSNGVLYDEITGNEGGGREIERNGKTSFRSDLQADHIMTRAGATYSTKYITPEGAEALKKFYNSDNNFQMMDATANNVKDAIHIYQDANGRVMSQTEASSRKSEIRERLKSEGNYSNEELNKAVEEEFKKETTEITHRASPGQITDAIVEKLENCSENAKKKLIEKGYLGPDGKVPESVKKKLESNTTNAQNAYSREILKAMDYKNVALDAASQTKKSIGKIIAGQLIYYVLPPVVYEIRIAIQNRNDLDNVLDKLKASMKRVGDYVLSKLKNIFSNVFFNSLKTFLKSFMDIIINMVLATVKKMAKLAKNLLLASVDSVRIIADKTRTGAEKADAVTNLLGVTVTSFAVELLFEAIEKGFSIPEWLLSPLQIIVTVICTNLTMLVLQKADLFDVRFGYKIRAIEDTFEKARSDMDYAMSIATEAANSDISELLRQAKEDCMLVYNNLMNANPYEYNVRDDLQRVSNMFHMDVHFDAAWLRFLGIN